MQSIRIPKVGKRQLENAVCWTAKKNIAFDERQTILDFEVQGEMVESGITKLSVLVCTAILDNKGIDFIYVRYGCLHAYG
ncbi:MAG: hypothetical protein KAT81_00365 [Syntrophobacterales bacterium]|nr:hypothetical protein [Syntrophobacterales bacterium]